MKDVKANSLLSLTSDTRKDEVDLTRRAIIVGGAGLLVGGLLGCGATTRSESGNRNIGIDGRDYSKPQPTETAREILLEARPSEIEIAPNRIVKAWTYDGKMPGTEIRVKEGERIRITVRNKLPEETTVHWHGQFQRGTNKMDGVPGVTQDPIPTNSDFVYDFHAEPAGSFFYHSHKGLQIERGLGGTLIVEPMREPLAYDRDYTVVLDDWLESTPEEALSKLKQSGGGMMGGRRGSNMQMGTGSEVDYQAFLINGRAPESPFEFLTKRGEKVRLRVINPSGSTIYRFAIAGHKLTVTHADGLPVKPVEVDTFEIAPGERYDVLVNADNPGIWAIAAIPADGVSNGTGRALLRYSDAQATSVPIATQSPMELNARMLSYNQLIALEPRMQPDAHKRRIDIALSGGMMSYEWTINGQAYPNAKPFEISAGELIRLTMTNHSMMRHPMHLHGHSFRLLQKNAGDAAPLKDTVIVNHMESVEVEFLADNPGDWAFHCHNAYHMDTGMMRVFKYV